MSQPEKLVLSDRIESRTSLFIVATLYLGRSSFPVRVRDLSPAGARIEGACLPAIGSPVTLRRGKLEAKGAAVWRDSDRAGLSFFQPIDVSRWLPSKTGTQTSNTEQVVFALKHAPRSVTRDPTVDAMAQETASSDLRRDLNFVRQGLIAMGEKLADDIILIATHPEIQFLDAAIQRVDKILCALDIRPSN